MRPILSSAASLTLLRGPAQYGYFDHDADIGIEGQGEELEAAMEAAAEAMFALMTDLARVQLQEKVPIEFFEADPALALVTWLNALLGQAQAERLVFGAFHLRREGAHWCGEAAGQRWSDDLPRGVEVKGATLTMLDVHRQDGSWHVRCVLDV